MNVADLLQEAPSDKRRPAQREQPPPPPPPRERSRDRQPSSQGQQPDQQRTAHPSPHQHQHQHRQPSPPQPYHPPGSKHSRPSSPPRSYQHEHGGSHSQQSQQRLPPPSAIIESLVGPRREDAQQLPPPHEPPSRSQYGQPSLGPPGPLSQQPYDHPSSRSQSRSSSNSHSHHQTHPHGHSSAQSSMYMPPPNSRNSLHQSSKHGASGPGMPPPGHGSIPLYPTPVGPGMGPPPHHMESHPRTSYSEPSVMYSGHPHAPPGASIMGALPPPHSHPSHPHQQHPSIHSRHRRTGSGGYHSQGGSPAMGSLQRSPYDERGGPLPPPSQLGGVMGPGQSPSLSREPSNASLRNSHLLTGPGAAGMHANPLPSRDRERYERERERERERGEIEGRSLERREREMRGRDRDRMERELREREKYERLRERERREEEKMHERDAIAATVGPDGLTEADREREWHRRMQPPEPHAWPRFANPRMGDEKRDREIAMQQQLEWERDRELAMMEEKRARDAARDVERARQVQPVRTSTREREPREKDRTRDADRTGRRDKHPDTRRVSGEGWLPEPPLQEVWVKDGRERERDRDRELRERTLRDREREIRENENLELLRASRQGGQNPPHHHHGHHHLHRHQHQQPAPPGSQGHSKATKIRAIESEMTGPPMGPGGMPPPMSDMPLPSVTHRSMSKSSLGPGSGPGSGQMSHSQPPPQHFHPSNRLHPHLSHSFGNQSPMHYSRRSSPPPFANALNASNNFMQPRSPRPPMLPTVPPVHVGTFVYPRTPFPFLDFPSPPDVSSIASTSLLPQKEIPELRAIIYMPSGFLPTRRPKQPRIWGGALIPSFSPIFAAPQLLSHMQSGMPYGYAKPHPYEIHGGRRVYTDDSDLFLCALHAGWVTWNMTRVAQEEGKDLRFEIRLTREARFIGGMGERYRGQEPRETSEEDDGRGLRSAGWGNSHEGAGIEILRAEFVKKGTAHKFGLRNRSQRLAEHNERSITLGCVPDVRKRKRRAAWYDEDEEEAPTVHDAFLAADAKLCSSRTLVLGYQLRPSTCGFKYDADAVKSALFSDNADAEARPAKKRRLANNTGLQMRVNGVVRNPESPRGVDDAIVIETLTETFLISPQAVDAQDKENAMPSRRYTVSLVNRQSTKPMKSKPDSGSVSTAPSAVLTEAGKEQPATVPSTVEASSEGPSQKDKTTGAVAVDAGVPSPNVNEAAQSAVTKASPKTAEDTAMASEIADVKASPEPNASKASSTGGSSTPMDLETPEPRSEGSSSPMPQMKAASPAVMGVETKAAKPQLTPSESEPKEVPPIQVLQKNLTEDDLLFDTDGISVLSSDVENGMRSGWKIEAKTWRWADESLISLV